MNTLGKKRISFIDLAKGICILLVVMQHTYALPRTITMSMLRMPLYFILSGLFFKTYGGFIMLTIKKTNKLLIPMIFFHIIGFILYLIVLNTLPSALVVTERSFFDFWYSTTGFNVPIWFLLSLFWCNVIFCIICLAFKNEYIRGVISIICACVGCYLGSQQIALPAFMGTSLSVMPFFHFGYILKKTPILYPNQADKYNWIFIPLLILIGCTCAALVPQQLEFYTNNITGGIPAYCGAIALVISLLLFCKKINSLPVISYLGRYSIVVLVWHYLIKRPVHYILCELSGGYFDGIFLCNFLITTLICLALIPICKKLIPWFIAQKDLIPESFFSKKESVKAPEQGS